MIISASRRTDIPAFYTDWMLRRLREGRVLFPYPRDPHTLGSVRLSPANVDCIVFWTKNAAPMLERLHELDALGYRYYFTFTVTGYGPDVEPGLPPKPQVAETFRRLADRIGPGRVDWRYDPILLDARHPVQWHLEAFGGLCRKLAGSTTRCIVNMVKEYRHLPGLREPDPEAARRAAAGLAAIAAEYRLPLAGCVGAQALRDLGIGRCACIDRQKIERITGSPIRAKKDPGQPAACSCVQSVDIGMYDTCGNGCAYCYAVTAPGKLARRRAAHDPASPILAGRPAGDETVRDRTGPTLRTDQTSLFSR